MDPGEMDPGEMDHSLLVSLNVILIMKYGY